MGGFLLMNDDIAYFPEKLKSMIHYIISKCSLNANFICLLLYFSDFNYYELYETPISGEKYIKKTNGPISSHFLELKEELLNEGKIKETNVKIENYKYCSLKKYDTSYLNKEEIDVIDNTINKIAHMDIKEILRAIYLGELLKIMKK